MHAKFFFPFMIMIILLSSACKSKETLTRPVATAPPIIRKEVVGQSWEVEWDFVQKEAKKEGKVTVRSELPQEVNRALMAAFKERAGVLAEVEPGARGGMTSLKILSEQKASLYLVDFVLGSVIANFPILQPAKAIEPFDKLLFLPEVIEPKAWYDSKFPWFDEERTTAYLTLAPTTPLIVNTSLVRPGEIKSYRDLLHSQWKKKILFNDPTFPGQGNSWFSVYAREENLGLGFMESLAKQEPLLLRDVRIQAEWVSRGKYPVSLAVGWILFGEFYAAGAPVALVETAEPDYLSGSTSFLFMMKNAPHPAAARLFLNWLLSREGMLVVQKSYERQSSRADTGTEGLGRTLAFRTEGEKYYNSSSEKHEKEKSAVYDPKVREIFGPLLR